MPLVLICLGGVGMGMALSIACLHMHMYKHVLFILLSLKAWYSLLDGCPPTWLSVHELVSSVRKEILIWLAKEVRFLS